MLVNYTMERSRPSTFGEAIDILVFRGHMKQSHEPNMKLPMHQMKINIQMFDTFTKHRFGRDMEGALVVTI